MSQLKQFKHFLKNNLTNAENRLWYYLKNCQLIGCKFRRQHILCDYIVDFICLERNLIIELDGGQHCEQIIYDDKRTQQLNAIGFKVIRFWNNEVLQHTEAVLEVIKQPLEGSVI